jgi:Fe-S-cluster-containing hydrogenase component 2
MACHFRHAGTFGVAESHIRIHYDPESGALEVQILPACNLCAGAPKPACVEACVPRAVVRAD